MTTPRLNGGAGNDQIEAYNRATVDAGSGNDVVSTYSYAKVSAGDGNDRVLTDDHSVVDAGAGDDAIQVRSSSTVTGGAGNDSISVTGEGTTVNFANGDGSDVIDVNGHDVALAISGYSLNDVVLTQQNGKAVVNFKGSSDSLTFDLGGAGSVQLSFSDSASVDIKA